MEWLYAIIVGAIAGFLAGQFMRGGGYGLIGDVIVGIIGAGLARLIMVPLGLAASGSQGNILLDVIVAFIGAVILIAKSDRSHVVL